MTRALILGIALFVLVWMIRRAFQGRREADRKAEQARADARQDGSGAGGAPAVLVACAHCGVLLPQAEALQEAGKVYCSAEHRRLGAR